MKKTKIGHWPKAGMRYGLALLALCLNVSAQAQVGQILWEDDFDTFDAAIWSKDLGDGCPDNCGWGGNELQAFQDDNVYIEEIPGEPGNFALVIEARNESAGEQAFTSGRVTSRNKLGLKYGMVELRIKVPDDLSVGLAPAAWMLGTNEAVDGWPLCGQIDLMAMGQNAQFRNEQLFGSANENDLVAANLTYFANSACGPDNPACAASISFDQFYNQPYQGATPLTDRFLIYRMYWDENEIRLTVEDDGLVQNFYTGPFPIGTESSEFQKPFYLLLDLAVGGDFTDAATNGQVSADLPGKMYVDYVRVRQWNGRGEVFTPERLMANAGADKSVAPGETLTLDAAGSYGPISTYSWELDGTEIATTAQHEVSDLAPGAHTFRLTVGDGAEATATDEVKIVVGGQGIGEVIWEDDFTTFNQDYWNKDVGDGCDEGLCGWGNQELQSYEEDNVYIEEIAEEPGNFALVLEAREETSGNSAFTSGKVTTENKVAIQYGVVEVRMKVPDLEDGFWPAAWLLGVNHRTVGWPRCGEIDMMEMGHAASVREAEGHFGSPNNFVGSNLLWYTGAACDAGNLSCAASIAFDQNYTTPYTTANAMNDRFMTYRIYWDDQQIRMVAVDNGTEFDLYTNPFPLGPNEGAFKRPFYFLLNLAVGGSFTGLLENEDITAPMPAKVYIDYVRVSEWNGVGEVTFPGGEPLANAGGDQVAEDLDQNGFETVTLDGTNSYGGIAAYEWSENGVVLSQDAVAEIELNPGVHNIKLTVINEAGHSAIDYAKIDVRELLWSDEFDTFDAETWTAITGDGCPDLCGWGNAELQYYLPDNVSVEPIPGEPDNNALAIEAKAEESNGYAFTSGRVDTQNKLSIQYGLVEIRMKAPDDLSTGLWPAAWLLGTNFDEVGWPRSGELDMMEMGQSSAFRAQQGLEGATENDIVGANVIFYDDAACAGDNPDCAASIAFDQFYNNPYRGSTPLTERFLTYRMYWDPNEIRLTAEDQGVEFDLYAGPFPLGAAAEEFHEPFFLILNLAVGGNFTDATTNAQVTADLPGKMLIDYVRVFKWNGYGQVAGANGLIANAGPDIIQLDEDGDGSETITLDGSGSAHHSGQIVSYAWSIDGETVANAPIASLQLARGVYQVTLTVTDGAGNTDTDTVKITISNGGLAPVAVAGPDQEVTDDNADDLATVTLDGSASEEASSPIVSYHWFAEGSEIASGAVAQVELSTGIYEITLEVTDQDGLVGTDEVVITVIDPDNQAPVADAGEDLTADDDDGDDLAAVALDGSGSSDADGTIVSYSWALGDEEIATGETATVSLSTGVYELTLTVTDDDGVSASDVVAVSVIDPDNQAPTANAGQDRLLIDVDLDGVEPLTLDASQSADTDGNIVSYVWREGETEIGTGVELEVEFSLGERIITLEVTDDDGVSATDQVTVIVNQLPVAAAGEDLLASDTNGDGEESVTLDASGSADPDGSIVSYSWVYDEAEIGAAETLAFAFPVGANEVILTVTDNFGSTAEDGLTVFVARTDNAAPTADAGPDIERIEDNGDGLLDVQLDGTASADADGSIFAYVWSEGGEQVATGSTPTVTLPVGQHTLTLEVTDNEGATANDQVTVTVTQRVNLALNQPVTTSSEEGPATPGFMAVDGDVGTRWASAFADPQWIYVDLGARYTINQVVLIWEAAYGSAYQVQISDNAANWTTIFTETAGDGETDDLSVSATGRYVRVFGTTRATEFGYSLYELEVYGAPASPASDATLSSLAIDGEAVSGFDSNVFDYSVRLPAGTQNAPTVSATATSPNANITSIVQAANLPGTATVTVVSEDGSNTLTYSVSFTVNVAGDNLAFQQPTMTSTDETPQTLGPNAVDGSLDTRWSSAFADPQWIYVDLGEEYSIGQVTLVWEAAFATAYEIQLSDDAANWTTVFTENAGNGGTDEITVEGTGRYVRMFGTARATAFGYSLFEFEVYEALPPETYAVTFSVTDDAQAPIEGARVAMLGEEQVTDANGMAVFEDLAAQESVSYAVSKEAYDSVSGTLNISGDLTETVTLSLTTYTVTFVVSDELASPIEGAEVSLLGQQALTDASGTAAFAGALPQADVAYTISREGFDPVEGTLTITEDVTETVTMNAAILGLEDGTTRWGLYPNPSSGTLTVEFYAPSTGSRLEVLSPSGQTLLSRPVLADRLDLSLEALASGLYFIRVSSQDGTTVQRFILLR